MVDAHGGIGQRRDVVARDEDPAAGPDGPKLGHGFAVARDDKRFAGRYRIDHLGVLVAQLALGNSPGHSGECRTKCYGATARSRRVAVA